MPPEESKYPPPKPAERAEIALEIRLRSGQTIEGSRKAYEWLYEEADISQRASFYLWLIDQFALQPNDTYVDISCGKGRLVALASERGLVAHGLDLAAGAVRTAKESVPDGHFVVGNGQWLPYASNSVTAISNIGSLEHYIDMRAAVAEMYRVLVPGGRAFVLVPNTFSLLHNIWIAFRQGRTNIDAQPIQRYLARAEWQDLLEESGLVIDRTIKYELDRPRTGPDLLRFIKNPKLLLRLFLAPFVPLNLAFCFVFFAHKPP